MNNSKCFGTVAMADSTKAAIEPAVGASDVVNSTSDLADEEDDLEKLQEEIRKMEEEAARIAKQTEELSTSHSALSKPKATDTASGNTDDDGASSGVKRDGFSVYVGQVDYTATPEELLAHFEPCGTVERVTIVCDKYTGKPKGFAYLEFQTEESMENAVKLDGSTFKDRTLKVTHKRVNDPNFFSVPGGRGGGGRGGGGYQGRGRGYRGGRGGFRGGRGGRGGYRGGGRGYQGGGGGYHPYY